MKTQTPPLWLLGALLMFPQIAETIYSPALPDLAEAFGVSFDTASLTLSVYFSAFAIGVVVWGRLADTLGRRAAMLLGLATYALGSLLAMAANDFNVVLIARMISAFGAATGSVVGQTMLRDSYEGTELGRIFSIMGMATAISPVVGLLLGSMVTTYSGYFGVFTTLMILAVALLVSSTFTLRETKPVHTQRVLLATVCREMLRNGSVWKNAILVAAFNLMLFGYYSIAPFTFKQLGFSSIEFGYTGVALALGSFVGSMVNKFLLKRGFEADALVSGSSVLAVLCSAGVGALQGNCLLVLPMVGIVVAYGIAIPNILGQALVKFRHYAGSAGALFGLMYYLMLGISLGIAGVFQNLGGTLFTASLITLVFVLPTTKKRLASATNS
ncbi:multidrug effflux MFS transporter [Grimontia sp. NTOU-MAR1]|uniref:multidrug effflux MFS transporter n=1 Tax=Grimontia sp. NTOU-MAR1 TaxID=3111011 RepID=UPI002DBF3C44|nr:multidrug effflux MFS transporter [Grimontia sp. NTOU-MAR1]WRW01021.1 multidrug effflux MFS transporter [Grimontia sp. NTOU-MAR1]